jgi:predicted solute-binding protein
MRIVVHDTLVTTPFTHPHASGWVDLGVEILANPVVRAQDLSPAVVGLIPSAEISLLSDSHLVVPEIAVISAGVGAIAMRVPVRPDEVAATPVRLYDVSGTAELLARATLQPFYGIHPVRWTSEDAADAQVVIVEGANAISEPEAGFSEDLCRAWFILTGQPVVTHVLVVPSAMPEIEIESAIETLRASRTLAHERRRDLKRELSEKLGIDRDRLTALFESQRYALEQDDRRALLMLLQRGNRGSTYPYSWEIKFRETPDSMENSA